MSPHTGSEDRADEQLPNSLGKRGMAAVLMSRRESRAVITGLLGITWISDGPDLYVSELPLGRMARTDDDHVAPIAMMTLVDASLGLVVRKYLGVSMLVLTVSLSVDLDREPTGSRLCCRARLDPGPTKLFPVIATLEDDDGVVGRVRGLFVSRDKHAEMLPAPSEGSVEGISLSEREREVIAYLDRLPGTGSQELRYADIRGTVEHEVKGGGAAQTATITQAITPIMLNRSDYLHGGLVAGLLYEACLLIAPPGDGRSVTVSIQFLRGIRPQLGPAIASSRVRRAGRRLSCVTAGLSQHGTEDLALATAVFCANQ